MNVICCNILLHNSIGFEGELVHELELVWYDWNGTIMLKKPIFFTSSSGATDYHKLCNRLHTQKYAF